MKNFLTTALLVPLLNHGIALAGEADVLEVKAKRDQSGAYTFSVTVRHDDTGWDHYANRWQVTTREGTVLGERILLHPHVDEQPFTRSQSGIVIPDGVGSVVVTAYTNIEQDGEKGRSVVIELE